MIGEQIGIVFFWIAIAAYICSFIFFAAKIKLPSKMYLKWATIFLVGGFISESIAIIGRYFSLGGFSKVAIFELFLFISWFVVLEALIIELWSKIRILGFYASLLAVILLMAGWINYEVPSSIFQNLKSIWIFAHVILIIIAYSAFIIAAGSAIFYLLQEKQLKEKKMGLLQKFLPSLQVLDESAYRSIVTGFIVFSIAMVLGFANTFKFWQNGWDINITISSFATWATYLFYLFSRFKIGWVGPKSSYVAIIGLIPLITTVAITALSRI